VTFSLPGPARLSTALTAVMKAHPYAANGSITPSNRLQTDAAFLWERLTGFRGNERDEAVDALHSLELRILLATARTRLDDPNALAVLATVMDRRRPEGATALAWDIYLVTDGHGNFRSLALAHARESAATQPCWVKLVSDRPPSEIALDLYHTQQQPFALFLGEEGLQLDQWPEFVRCVQRALLTPGKLSRLDRRESSEAIERCVQIAIPAGERESWYQTFLEETQSHRKALDHAVLLSVLHRFDEPAKGRPFWNGVSNSSRKAFDAWLMDCSLTKFMGEGERVDFWRKFLHSMKKAWTTKDRGVVFIDMDVAVAVQFVSTGTATYLFPRDAFKYVSRGAENEVRKSVHGNRQRSVASYEHRGNNWQWGAEAEVRRILAGQADD